MSESPRVKHTRVRGQASGRLLLVLLLVLTGCMRPVWTRITPVPVPYTLQRDKRVQVWVHHGSVHYWHAVIISQDSVSGIPYQVRADLASGRPRLIDGDTTRYGLPLAEVDSIRLGRYNRGNTYLLVADLTLIALYTVFSRCHDPLGCT